ncbi:MAG TPA: 50S ribosomal protein L22 [Anaerolineae bacterium]|nr:50S ribosomal protein L22 [Anaerolineae bacterium]
MAFEARSVARFIPLSPRKVRLVVDQVRGLGVEQALALLKFMPMAAAEPVSKVIASAAANGEENLGLTRSDLVVKEIRADEGPRRQWRRFGARGRFKPITRRSSHITVVLSER